MTWMSSIGSVAKRHKVDRAAACGLLRCIKTTPLTVAFLKPQEDARPITSWLSRGFAFGGLEEGSKRRGDMARTGRSIGATFPTMTANSLQYAIGQKQSIEGFGTADSGLVARLHAMDEMLQFASQLIAFLPIYMVDLKMTAKEIVL